MEPWAPSWLKWIAPIAIVGALVVIYAFPFDYWFYPRCLFHELTGLCCPGCGGLRSVQRLLHGDFAAAFRFHPLLYFIAPALFVCRRHLHKPACIWSFAAVVVAFTIARNL